MRVRLSNSACSLGLLLVSVGEKPKSSSEGALLLGGAFGALFVGACGCAWGAEGSTESAALKVSEAPAASVTFAILVASPSADTVTSYSPEGSFANVYVPAKSVCASVDWPVARLLPDTLALATAAPEESVTFPDSVASAPCARKQGASQKMITRTAAQTVSLAVLSLIRLSSCPHSSVP